MFELRWRVGSICAGNVWMRLRGDQGREILGQTKIVCVGTLMRFRGWRGRYGFWNRRGNV